jgi:DNA-binding beta-propeller fold protein YncE
MYSSTRTDGAIHVRTDGRVHRNRAPRLVADFGGIATVRNAFYLLSFFTLFLTGCGRADQPEAVWCDTGVGPGKVVYPRGITYDPHSDSFYIVDRTARVQRLDHDGQPMEEWSLPDHLIGKPVGLSVGPDGNVYVPDTHYQRVIVYDPAGKEVRRWGSGGKGPGQFIFPTDIAFDDQQNVYVSEYGDHDRIQVFDMHGKYLREFGSFGTGDGQFRRPQSMVITGQTMYVTDACNHRIIEFKTDGTFVKNIGHVGGGLGEFRFPYGLDIDAKGRLIVCEFGNNRVQLIDPKTGQGLATWGRAGRDTGEMAYPWGVVVDKRGRVVAVDAGNNRLQVFEF